MKSIQTIITVLVLTVASSSFATGITVPSVAALGSVSLSGAGSFAGISGTGSSFQGSANETKGTASLDFSTVGSKITLESVAATTSISGAEGVIIGSGVGGALAGGASIAGAGAVAPIVGFSLPTSVFPVTTDNHHDDNHNKNNKNNKKDD